MQQIVDFILELEKLKGVTRKTRPLGLERYENSAEHSWQIALLAASIAQYAGTPINIDRVISMLLIHDIGEIDTGDTIVYAEEGWAERKAAEFAAVTRIFGLLPEPQRESSWPCGRNSRTLKARRRGLPTRRIGRCRSSSISRMMGRAGGKTESLMSASCAVWVRRSRTAVPRCGSIWRLAWRTCARKAGSTRADQVLT